MKHLYWDIDNTVKIMLLQESHHGCRINVFFGVIETYFYLWHLNPISFLSPLEKLLWERAVAKRSYPTSKDRDSGWECQAVTAQEQPRGATPCPRSGAAGMSHPAFEVRGSSQEEQPQVQGAVAVLVQEGLEELSHVEGQERWQWGDTLPPR